jgi:hypothetical protein
MTLFEEKAFADVIKLRMLGTEFMPELTNRVHA